jgi:hypothetical protein
LPAIWNPAPKRQLNCFVPFQTENSADIILKFPLALLTRLNNDLMGHPFMDNSHDGLGSG